MRPHLQSAPTTDLHVCTACAQSFVVPNEILEVVPDNRHYVVELLCNSCGWTGVGTYDEDTMEAFDRELDRAQEELRMTAEVFIAENMREEIDAFVAALHADLILPEDF
jgi:hypothetical protein